MKITIIKADKLIRVDDYIVNEETFDFSDLPDNWHALQWEGDPSGLNGVGEIEYNATQDTPRTNVKITDIIDYMDYINQAKEIIANSLAPIIP